MKPKFILIIIVLILFSCDCFSQHHVKVKYMDFSLETIYDISFKNFNFAFANEFKYWEDRNMKDSLFRILFLDKFQNVNKQHIDVRCKITYFLNGKKRELCMNMFGVFTDGISFYKNERLFKFLKKELKQ